MPKLVVDQNGVKRTIPLTGVLTMGRQSGNDLQLHEEKASRHHARIVPAEQGFLLEDLGSANGTLVNGKKVARRRLEHGDRITIGRTSLLYQDELSDSLQGDLIAGQYRLQERIGQGGMGAVYKAVQISMDRVVALKLLRPELTRSPEFVEIFTREARLAGQLSHPAIIHVYDFGEARGTYYLSMEYVEGQDVQRILDKHRKLPVLKALHIAGRVAEALEHAHGFGIIHRDVKPQNIMLDHQGDVKLADLGLAKGGRGEGRGPKGAGAIIMGTPHYMAPEVGKRQAIDGRADLYSLGATLYHMITGRVPFDGPNSLSVITKHINQELPSPKQYDLTLPDAVCDLITRMMAKEPDDRPASAGALAQEIKEVAARETAALQEAARRKEAAVEVKRKPPARAPERREADASRSKASETSTPSWVFVAIAGIVLAIGGVVWTILQAVRTPPDTGGQGSKTLAGPANLGAGNGPNAGPAGLRDRILEILEQARQQEERGQLRQAVETIGQASDLARGSRHEDFVRTRLERVRAQYGAKSARRWKTISRAARAARSGENQPGRRGPAGNGPGREQILRWTHEYLKQFPDSPHERDARALLASLGSQASGGGGVAQPDPFRTAAGGDPNRRAPLDSAAKRWARVKNQAAKIEREGLVVRARRLLERFIRQHPTAPQAAPARKQLAALKSAAEMHLNNLLRRGNDLSREQRYGLAAHYFLQVISADRSGPYGRRAQVAIEGNNAQTQNTYKATAEKAHALFAAYRHAEARRVLELCLRTLIGTKWEQSLMGQIEALTLIEELFDRVAHRSEKTRGAKRPVVKVTDPVGGRLVPAYVVRTKGTDVFLSHQGAQFKQPWSTFTDPQVSRILGTYATDPRDHLGIGVFFLRRENRALAKVQLQVAFKSPALSEQTARYLAQVDQAMQLVSYDWSTWRDQQDWSLDGDWSILEGQLVQLDPETEASARHLKGPYKASEGFHLSFDVTIREGAGVFTAELEMDATNSLGVTFDADEGFLVHGSVDGTAVSTRRKDLRPQPGKTYHVHLAVVAEKLRCVLDNTPIPVLDCPGANAVTGRVGFKTFGVSIGLDNILIRQGE